MKSGVPYSEGDWFAVPLGGGGFAVGLVARANPRKAALLGYFFGPRRDELPDFKDVASLTSGAAVLVGICSHLGLSDGLWPILGRDPAWNREAWPMPVMIRHEELTGRYFRVYRDEEDLVERIREERIAPEEAEGPEDIGMGAGFVESRLTRLLQ
jgi:hypothetical protein